MGQLNQTFRENLKFYRKKAQLTQAALAERVEISITFLAEMELGRRCPSFPTLERLAQALGIEPFRWAPELTRSRLRLQCKISEPMYRQKRFSDGIGQENFTEVFGPELWRQVNLDRFEKTFRELVTDNKPKSECRPEIEMFCREDP